MSTHSARDLEQIYKQRFSGSEAYRTQIWSALTSMVFSKWVAPEHTVLDLGSGYCEFINNISARVKFAMDLNPATSTQAADDVKVILQDCSEPWPIQPDSLDIVFTSNFFEHLPDKSVLERIVRSAHRSLKTGGRLIALGPNVRHTSGAYWDFYDHYIPLTDLSVIELFQKCGFHIEHSWAQFLPYTMARGPRYPVWILKAYLMMPWVWRIFGQQFLVIGRKIERGES